MTFQNLWLYLNNSVFKAVSNEMFLAVTWALIASMVYKKRIIFNSYAHKYAEKHRGLIIRFFLFMSDIILTIIIAFALVMVVVVILWFIDGIFI